MPPKAKIAAPVDRPLSRAYLREFTGWSTAYPPGLSEPTSLLEMKNCHITTEGAVAVRPALRSIFRDDVWMSTTYGASIVGSFEPFFTNDGDKALLFAVREMIEGAERIGFKVAVYDTDDGKYDVYPIDDATHGFSVPQGIDVLSYDPSATYVRYVQIDNKIFALSNGNDYLRIFQAGTAKIARKIEPIDYPFYSLGHRLTVRHPDDAWIAGSQVTVPAAETATTSTLVHSTAASNVYNFAYFYTFNNEIGESAPSMISLIRTQRRFSAWNEDPTDDSKSPDQLVASIPEAVFDAALAQGALSWSLYMLTWSDQDSVPVEGVLIKTTTLEGEVSHATHGWASHTPLIEGRDSSMALPNAGNRVNYSIPSRAAQGLVAGDRLVLVNDRSAAAVIRWSSNQQGEYTNFSASKGGGYKTLTSGNLYIPATVKLWQNPQSVDTITVLCLGVDGYSTSYYMNPATSVSGQSQSTTIMGFEETTATPGTVSPYGCEVLNNALYHPLDVMLMKSTASNYNISHKTMTEVIQNKWAELVDKQNIVSSQMDNKLFFLVHNPDGEELEEGCFGNEVWICDTERENAWSRWTVQGCSLRRLEILGKLYMAIVQPDAISTLDPAGILDTWNDGGVTAERAIPWEFETNTQGANRAHDAWTNLQQVQVTLGNFTGSIRFGIRGWTKDGKAVDKSKVYHDATPITERPMPWDVEDYLLTRYLMKEWRFYASSVDDVPSRGQVNLVQYRYTPISVNIGYEYGSTETLEYNRSLTTSADQLTDGGVPRPFIDTRRP